MGNSARNRYGPEMGRRRSRRAIAQVDIGSLAIRRAKRYASNATAGELGDSASVAVHAEEARFCAAFGNSGKENHAIGAGVYVNAGIDVAGVDSLYRSRR